MINKLFGIWQLLRNWISGIRILGVFLGVLGVAFSIIGNAKINPGKPITSAIGENYWRTSGELISLAFTVLIIDGLNEMREIRAETRMEKSRLLLQLASPNNIFAIEACRQLNAQGWLNDGTLSNATLIQADLNGADMSGALMDNTNLINASLENVNFCYSNLQGSMFRSANMKNALLKEVNVSESNFRYADLSNAVLREANLEEAHLSEANLEGANLLWANLTNAQMLNSKFNEFTILPDGSNWTPDTDMKQFTDEEHPAYKRFKTRWNF